MALRSSVVELPAASFTSLTAGRRVPDIVAPGQYAATDMEWPSVKSRVRRQRAWCGPLTRQADFILAQFLPLVALSSCMGALRRSVAAQAATHLLPLSNRAIAH